MAHELLCARHICVPYIRLMAVCEIAVEPLCVGRAFSKRTGTRATHRSGGRL